MAGEHDQAALAAEEQFERVSELLEHDVLGAGVDADQAGREEHLDEEHEELLHAARGRCVSRSALGHVGEGAAEVGQGALAVLAIDAVEEVAEQSWPCAGWR